MHFSGNIDKLKVLSKNNLGIFVRTFLERRPLINENFLYRIESDRTGRDFPIY